MNNGDMVWIYPRGTPEQAVEASIDLISSNGISIALRLRDEPSWFRIRNGLLLHDAGGIEMLLMRESIGGVPNGPWRNILDDGRYEIREVKA